MIRRRHAQASLWDGWLAAEVADLWEPRMLEIDEVLRDEPLLEPVYEAQGQRHPQSRRRGRHQTPAEVVLRMLLLQHVRNWSYETLERAVRDNLVYRSFCRIGREKVPDARAFVAVYSFEAQITLGNKKSKAMLDHVRSLDQSRLRGFIKTVTRDGMKGLEKALTVAFDLTP